MATRIGSTGYVLCGSPAYLAAAGTPAHPDDLHGHSVVGFVQPDTATRFAHRFLVDGAVRTLTFPFRLTVDDGEALVGAGVSSVGLLMATDYLVEGEIAAGRLVRVLAAFELPPVPISAVHLPTRHPSPATRALVSRLHHRSGGHL